MVQFYNRNHYNYTSHAHSLLAVVNGMCGPRVAQEATWNRTANIVGKEGHNIELDLVNEHLNLDFKGTRLALQCLLSSQNFSL